MKMLNVRGWILFLCTLAGVALISGCAATNRPGKSAPARFFRSADYVLYRVSDGETPVSLAERFLGDRRLDWMIEDATALQPFTPRGYVVIPLKVSNIGGVFATGVQEIPILCYHRFGNHCESPLCVPEGVFDRQMQYLKSHGYRTIGPDQLLAFLEFRKPIPRKSVMITVDDGYSSFYTVAYPILKKYGFTATLFIYTNYVGVSEKALSWRQLRELKRLGFTIGSHTIAHSDLSRQGADESDTAYMERLRREIVGSKKILDAKLDQDTTFFAYPFGRVNRQAMVVTHEAGYQMAVTVHRGGNPFFSNRYALQRDQILKRDMATFASRLQTFQTLSLR